MTFPRLSIVALAVFVAGVIFFGFFFHTKTVAPTMPDSQTSLPSRSAWIEVVSSGVFLQISDDAQQENRTSLSTGDVVVTGDTIATDATGRAVIHFPDTSTARLDSNTSIHLDAAEYNDQNQAMIVKMFLNAGRVWSKIFELSTPDSTWQVKTSNAVATVRGTAFGMEYTAKKSHVIGSQHTVHVALVDPKTLAVIEKTGADVSEDTSLVVDDAVTLHAQQSLSKKDAPPVVLTVAPISAEIKTRDWVKRGVAEDEKFDEVVKKLQETTSDKHELRLKLREVLEKPFSGRIKQRPTMSQDQKLPSPTPVDDKKPPEIRLEPSDVVPVPSDKPQTSVWSGRSISIHSPDLSAVSAGQTLKFAAAVVDLKGISHDVTASAVWTVVGPIGVFREKGVLFAELTGDASELEQGLGAVLVSWKDPVSGSVLSAKTTIFSVHNQSTDPNLGPLSG